MTDKQPHGRPIDQVVAEFESHLERGLSPQDAGERLARHGANELTERPRPGFWAQLWNQFNNYLVIILVAAAVISLLLGEWVDSIAIMVIVVLNAVVGMVQESKAEQALAALKKMAAPNSQVIRDGHQMTIPSREIVRGDIVVLEAGNFVPADLRLFESFNLKVEEASLTGESVPVEKDHAVVLDQEIPLGDRRNTAFMGTLVTYGRGKGLVTGTGMNTQIGLIAQMIQSFEEEATPLQKKLAQLGKILGSASLAICAFVFVYGLFRDTHIASLAEIGLMDYLRNERVVIISLFMTAVSLAIAAVPEGLPAIVTICLALGMQRMIKHHALIRKLPAVETLGCATVILSDKTGTLTQNQMTVVRAWAGGRQFRVSGEGYVPKGEFFLGEERIDPLADPDASALLQGAIACNDAQLEERPGESAAPDWNIIGDPTEGALIVAAAKTGLRQDAFARVLPRVQEIPFDSERKRMTTIHRHAGPAAPAAAFAYPALSAIVKGAPDVVLDLCTAMLDGGQVVPLSHAMRASILEHNRDMASAALRVLGVAFRPLAEMPARVDVETVEKELVFVGLLGMIDPPRPEVIDAIKVAKGAGLKTVMVTGDYKDTAEAIARDIGLRTPGGMVLTGAEIDKLSDAELATLSDRIDVCCRVSPQHKTRIVDAFKAHDHVVAMTGDGVNDAPALKRANIGVAMGITGSDVAKQTADMVLTDDNFASIVSAIEQGRVIYSNIRKFVYFLLACNVGEILIVFGAMLFGMPMPLRPVQLLWLNLVSDGAPALALGLEKGDDDIMQQPARSPKEPVITRDMALGIGVVGVVDMLAILGVFYLGMQRYPGHLEAAQTMAFVTLCTSELIRAFAARSEYQSVFALGLFSNRWMVAAVAVSFALVMAVVYLPFLAPFFDAVPLGVDDWLLMLPFFFASPVAMEMLKFYFRGRRASTLRESRPLAALAAAGPAGLPVAAPALPETRGGHTMLRILVPVAGSHNDRFAAQEVVRRFMNHTATEVHLLNVQAPFSADIARFTSRKNRSDYHHEQADRALAPIREMLDRYSIPYAVHRELGRRAEVIATMAKRLHCDQIVMATARKNSLTRWIENSVTNKVIELTSVPVEIVAGDSMSPWERYGIPAALAAAATAAMMVPD